jgi:hypothetical protein
MSKADANGKVAAIPAPTPLEAILADVERLQARARVLMREAAADPRLALNAEIAFDRVGRELRTALRPPPEPDERPNEGPAIRVGR